MFNWLKKGGRKEQGWKFWIKLIIALTFIIGVVSFIVYHIIQGTN